MDSIFSRVNKSLVGPGVYKPIKAMSSAERGALKTGLNNVKRNRNAPWYTRKLDAPTTYTKIYGDSPETIRALKAKRTYYAMKATNAQLSSSSKLTRPGMMRATASKDIDDRGFAAATTIVGSKRNPTKTLIHGKKTSQLNNALEHEAEHLKPKRSGFRMAEVASSRGKLGREEARADWMSGSSRYDIPRRKESGYAKNARARRMGVDLEAARGVNLHLSPTADLGSNKFSDAYAKQQRMFRKKRIKFGANAEKNRKYIESNFSMTKNR